MPYYSNVKESFSAKEAASLAKVPYASLDYWARTKLVVPSIAEAKGTGTERRYSFKDLLALRIAKELREAGISTQALRTAIGYVQRLSNPLEESRILAIGTSVAWVDGRDEIVDVLKRPDQKFFAFMLDFPRAAEETKLLVEQLGKVA